MHIRFEISESGRLAVDKHLGIRGKPVPTSYLEPGEGDEPLANVHCFNEAVLLRSLDVDADGSPRLHAMPWLQDFKIPFAAHSDEMAGADGFDDSLEILQLG